MHRTTVRRQKPLDLVRLEDRTAPAVIAVTSLANAGGGTLRQAILDANNETTHPGPDTIVFSDTVAGGTVKLSTIAGIGIFFPVLLLLNVIAEVVIAVKIIAFAFGTKLII